jgi:hypothetical protein
MPPYPETSGYIIPTLLSLSHAFDDPALEQTAWEIGLWLTGIQLDNGGFVGREIGVQQEPDVFDTGMILLGFNALISRHREPRIMAAAARAANFLTASLDTDGCFAKHISHGMVHTYNVRSAWALLAFGRLGGDARLEEAAERNLNWTLQQQTANGFFLNNAFKPRGNANTHGIAYVLRGLLQSYFLTGRRDLLRATLVAAEALLAQFERRHWLAAEIGPDWSFRSNYICLTGYAQLAIVFYLLSEVVSEGRFAEAASSLIDRVAGTLDLTSPDANYYGAVAGSFPIHGNYAPLQYPNWATKFFIDAFLLRRTIESKGRSLDGHAMYAG